jgi:hypothetical protein
MPPKKGSCFSNDTLPGNNTNLFNIPRFKQPVRWA